MPPFYLKGASNMEVMTKCVKASIKNGQTSQVSSVPELAA